MRRVIYHPEFQQYNLGAEHPFSPLRVEMVLDLLKEWGHTPEFSSPQEVGPDELETVHDSEYIKAVEAVSSGKAVADIGKYGLGTADNPIMKGMASGARKIAGGTLLGAQMLLEGSARKVLQLGGGFHHAQRSLAAGFCLYNDLALAINEMIAKGWHVAYLDIDVHHGDGVQQIFYSNDKVMTISLHESGEYIFPGSGWVHELGRGMGRSLKLNLPLEPFTEGESYMEVVEKVVEEALYWFKPDALIVQAGADAHFSDPLADLMLTTQDYERLFRKIFQLSETLCNNRLLITLGGGYSFQATARIWTILYKMFMELELPETLPDAWRARWESRLKIKIPSNLHDPNPAFDPIPRKAEVVRANRDLIQRLMDAVAADWL